MFNKRIEFEHQPIANAENIVRVGQVRFTLITDRLIRMEHSRTGSFRDLSTQTFIHRDLGKVAFKLTQTEDEITIDTGALLLNYRITEIGFTIDTLNVEVRATGKTWTYSREGSNLKGTIRTLDGTDGAQRLDDGLMSRDGYALVDDTKSFVFTEDHWMKQEYYESGAYEDLYLFAYGLDYKACLADFTKVAGEVPMLHTQHGIYDLYDAHIYSEDVGVHKPDRRMFEAALRAVNLSKDDVSKIIMVGNNLSRDVKGANEMGITSVFMSWTDRYPKEANDESEIPDYTIVEPLELLDLIDKLEERL